MSPAITADDLEQLELITDDPREVSEVGALQLLREWREAKKEHGDLLARPLAAEILGVPAGHVAVWCMRGRLSDVKIGPVRLVPVREVLALMQERAANGVSVGGRGKKLPSMAEVVRLGSQIFGD